MGGDANKQAARKPAEKKVRLRFDSEPQNVLVVDAHTKIQGGADALVSRDRADYLLKNGFSVSVVDGTKFDAAWPQHDAELDAIAVKVGLIWPAPAAGNTSLSIEEKVAALEQAGHTPDSVE